MRADRVGKYRLLHLLATGGMGEVFLARQEGPAGFARPAVVKRILAHLSKDPAFVEMFLNEARLAALLTHPNCIQIFELGEDQGTYFIAMEFIHGRTLRAIAQRLRAKNRPFPSTQLARICAQALQGLHYAHSLKGAAGESLHIVHRDMSPDNVMVGFDGAVKVLDFGIAKATRALGQSTSGTVKGKFAYMSPEQLNAEDLDGRADQWAMGVLLYELLAGGRPYTAPIDAALINLILNTEPAPLKDRAPNAPPALVAIVERAMKKNRDERFPSAEQMAFALERYAASESAVLTNGETQAFMRGLFADEELDNPAGMTPSGGYRAYQASPPRGRRLAAAAAGAVVTGLVCGGIWRLTRRVEPPPVKRVARVAAPIVDAGAALAVEVADSGAEPQLALALDAGAPAHVARAPSRGMGKLDLRVNPWAEVFEGRRSLGVTPMPPLELVAGTHQLTLKNSELKVSKSLTVKVTKGATVVQRIDLTQ